MKRRVGPVATGIPDMGSVDAPPQHPHQDIEHIAYTVKDACKVLGVGRSTLYRLAAEDGLLDARKVFGRTIVSRASILNYFASLPRADINSKK